MKNFLVSIALLFTAPLSFAQNEVIHAATVLGSFALGDEEVTSFYDEDSQCERKSNAHSKNLFIVNESVQVKISDTKDLAEIVKEGLSEEVFVNKDCETAARKANGEKINVSCGGTCACSLQGVLSEEGSYVECSCETCTMELVFTSSDRNGGEPTEYTLDDQTTMEVPFLNEFLTYAAGLGIYTLTEIEIYRDGDDTAVEYVYKDANGVESTTMFAKANGKKYHISCEGVCGCREVYSFETNSASCSCDDCTMTVEEVSTN